VRLAQALSSAARSIRVRRADVVIRKHPDLAAAFSTGEAENKTAYAERRRFAINNRSGF
jgi:2-oxo-4-hydroxy-4-carboxy--5-ureidoimidazoline (OHCU) decarboxylase